MILNIFRILFGYNWELEERARFQFTNGVQILYICKKTGRMKQIFVG